MVNVHSDRPEILTPLANHIFKFSRRSEDYSPEEFEKVSYLSE